MTLPVQSARCRRPLVTYLLISMGLLSFITKAAVPPPQAQIIPHKLTAQGETRIDNYYWLRDDGRQNSRWRGDETVADIAIMYFLIETLHG